MESAPSSGDAGFSSQPTMEMEGLLFSQSHSALRRLCVGQLETNSGVGK